MSEPKVIVENKNIAFDNRIQTFSIVNYGYKDIQEFFTEAFTHFESRIHEVIQEQYIVKVGANFMCEFEKKLITGDGEEIITKLEWYFQTEVAVIDFETDYSEFYQVFIVDYVLDRIEDMYLKGSGFTLGEIVELEIQISSFERIRGATFIDLPQFVKDKKAVINVQNGDNKCFQYAILSALYPAGKNAHRVSNYTQYVNTLNFDGIKFPVDIRDISKFEAQNPTISINVYMFDENECKIRTLRLTKNLKDKHIHLLLLTKEPLSVDGGKNESHYCWIKRLSALIGAQCSANKSQKYFCDRCLNYFLKMEKLAEHLLNCEKQNECTIEMPTAPNNILQFKNFSKQLSVPFVIYSGSAFCRYHTNLCDNFCFSCYKQ